MIRGPALADVPAKPGTPLRAGARMSTRLRRRVLPAVSVRGRCRHRAGDRRRHADNVPGYRWSHAEDEFQQHQDAWIDDPIDNVRYTAHHYWRRDYDRTYDMEVTDAAAAGY